MKGQSKYEREVGILVYEIMYVYKNYYYYYYFISFLRVFVFQCVWCQIMPDPDTTSYLRSRSVLAQDWGPVGRRMTYWHPYSRFSVQ